MKLIISFQLLLVRFDFLEIRLLDFIDIILVAFLLYLLYKLLKGTIAANILAGLLSVYFIWLIVKALGMKLLGSILGQFIGVGVILVLIVFQQEIRKFLLVIGQSNIFVGNNKFKNMLPWNWSLNRSLTLNYSELLGACSQLSETKTGALIIVTKSTELRGFASTGLFIDAELSQKLLISIFNKESPIHDGAVILVKNKIKAASCVLPISDNNTIPDNLGLRHRAAIGISEQSDAIAIIISETNGFISVAIDGHLQLNIEIDKLKEILQTNFLNLNNPDY